VKKYMIRVQALVDDKGKPVIKVEGKTVEVLSGQELDSAKLTGLLRPLVQGQPPRTEMLLDAHDVTWGLVVAIQDAARAAGVRLVHHQVRKPKV
jgi:hypothetical protein